MSWFLIILGCLIFDEIRSNQEIRQNCVVFSQNEIEKDIKPIECVKKINRSEKEKKRESDKIQRSNELLDAQLLCLGEKSLQRNKI